ncbi:DUF2946 domain-containing protein [Caballeronia sp. dw_276]|uniref:DUF2946 domain-containing protein n=1 Tax=Caballeronia sp. dw_276 TaxID=2719795 RepID=UPI001BD50711|nr:DUF2946 domain-containing protein [Caballeronia sp. dw_276]
MRRRLVRKFGSLIGLLAILMTTLAPAVSQALVSSARANAIFSAHCSAITEFRTQVANLPSEHPPAHRSIAGHWDACGYCNFTAHSPAAPPSINTLPAHVAAAIVPVNAAPQPVAPFAPLFAAQPRAPPFLV